MSFPELWRRILEVRRSRRSFLVHLCSGAAATLFPPALTAEPTRYSGFQMGGNPVEMWLTGVNEQVLRASILPAGFPYPPSAAFADGSLLARTWPQPTRSTWVEPRIAPSPGADSKSMSLPIR